MLSKASQKSPPKRTNSRTTVSSSRDVLPISSSPIPDRRSDVSRDNSQARSLVPEMKLPSSNALSSAPGRIEAAQPANKFWQRMRARVPSRVETRSPSEDGGMSLGPVNLQPRQISPMKTLFSDVPPRKLPRSAQRKGLLDFDPVRDHPGNGSTDNIMADWGVYPRSKKMKSAPDFAPEFESRSSSILIRAGDNTYPMKRRRPIIRREST